MDDGDPGGSVLTPTVAEGDAPRPGATSVPRASTAGRPPHEAVAARRRTALLAAGVALFAVLPFAGALGGPFVFDDDLIVVRNSFVHDLSWWWRWFTHDFWDLSPNPDDVPMRLVYWRPLVLASYASDWQLWFGHPLGFHLTNLLLHATAGVLAFVTLRRWVGADLPAALGAALFAVHPSKAESVAWIAGRTDVMVTVGMLLATAGVARRLRGERGGAALEALGTVGAYLSKELAVTLPALAAVEAWLAAGRPRPDAVVLRRLATAAGPQLLVALAYALGRQFWRVSGAERLAIRNPTTMVWSVLDSLGNAAVTTLWPANLGLGRTQIALDASGAPPWGHALLGGVILVLLLLVVARAWTRAPTAAVTLALFLVLLSPGLGLAIAGNGGTAPTRTLYLPLFALAWLLAEGLARVGKARSVVAFGVSGLLLCACTARSAVRSLDFGSEERFWAYEIRANPQYGPALTYFAGMELARARPRSALVLAHHAFVASERTSWLTGRGTSITLSLEALLWITPDGDRAALRSVQRFIREVLERRTATLELPRLGLHLEVLPDSPEARWLLGDRGPLLVLEADAASRLGDDAAARAACGEAIRRCNTCGARLRPLVLAAARTGDLALAGRALEALRPVIAPAEAAATLAFLAEAERRLTALARSDEQRRPLRHARFYALTTAWGRAYAEVQPLLATADEAPRGTALALGEYAFRAGDEARARALLGRHLPADQVEAAFAAWALQMRWVDAPSREPLPPALSRRLAAPAP